MSQKENNAYGEVMRNIGFTLMFVSVVWGYIAFNMQTYIATEAKSIGSGEYSIEVPSQTVHNLSLADERRNHLLIASVLFISGTILFGFGSAIMSRGVDESESGTRQCPFCAEAVKIEAVVCRFCQKDIPPVAEMSVPLEDQAPPL